MSINNDNIIPFSNYEAKNLIMFCMDGKLYSASNYSNNLNETTYKTIEVAGMPMSYKSTLVLASTVYFRTHKLQTDYIKERSSAINKRNYPVHYTLSLATDTVKEMLIATKDQAYFLDRGVYDQLAFLLTYLKIGLINNDLFNLNCRYLVGLNPNRVSGMIICHSYPETSLKREGKRLYPGYVMNKEFLEILDNSYKDLPQLIAKTRAEVGLGNEPFPIISLDSSIKWLDYRKLFIKASSTFFKLNYCYNFR